MATAPDTFSSMRELRRSQVMLGELPDDFLRITNTNDRQISMDQEAALALQQQYANYNDFLRHNIRGRLTITVTEAKLVKNYGVTRMDPYVRLRIAHQIFETKTCCNGAKNPIWNRVFHCFLPNGVDAIHIELFDECAFSPHGKIAWTLYTIPQAVFDGETVENWVPLSGKQGEGKEGTICLVLSFAPFPPCSSVLQLSHRGNILVSKSPSSHVVIQQEEIDILKDMFPNIEEQVIKTIMETERGNKERTINCLIQMNSD